MPSSSPDPLHPFHFFSRQPFRYPPRFSEKRRVHFQRRNKVLSLDLPSPPESFFLIFCVEERCQFDVFQRTKCSAFPRGMPAWISHLVQRRRQMLQRLQFERRTNKQLMLSVIGKHNVLLLPAVLKFTTRSIILYTSTRSTCYRRLCALSKDKQPICLPVSI